MNKSITSKEQILQAGKQLLLEQGSSAFGMRAVAAACGVAVGSIYNYFPSKAALLSAVIQGIWIEIFQPIKNVSEFTSFTACIQFVFDTFQDGERKYPGFTTLHNMNFAKEEKPVGRVSMRECYGVLQQILLQALKADPAVRKNVFDKVLTEEIFANYVMTLMMHLLLQKQDNCDALLAMIRQCIY